jgi:hypothetical protein
MSSKQPVFGPFGFVDDVLVLDVVGGPPLVAGNPADDLDPVVDLVPRIWDPSTTL